MKWIYCHKCLTLTPHDDGYDGLILRCTLCKNVRNAHLSDKYHWAKKYDRVKHITHNKGVGGGVLCNKYGALLGNNYATRKMRICSECQKEKWKQT